MNPLKVAVTGGSGRIGAALVRHLSARGHHVVNVDRAAPTYVSATSSGAAAAVAAAVFVQADLRERASLEPIFKGLDAVCHLGEYPGVFRGMTPDGVYAHNTAAGSTAMQAAVDLGIKRIIYTSTCQVYGAWGEPMVPLDHFNFDEEHPKRPANAYSASKFANEAYARMLSRSAPDRSISIFRFPAVFPVETGPGLRERMGEFLKKRGGVDGYGTYLLISDAVEAYALALEANIIGCEAYHFSAPDLFSSAPITEWMKYCKVMAPIVPADYPPFKSPLNCEKAKRMLGWTGTAGLR